MELLNYSDESDEEEVLAVAAAVTAVAVLVDRRAKAAASRVKEAAASRAKEAAAASRVEEAAAASTEAAVKLPVRKAVSTLNSAWIEDDSEEEVEDKETDNSDEKDSCTIPSSTVTSASAASLLALDVKPKFLKKENPEEFQVKQMVKHSYAESNVKPEEARKVRAPPSKVTTTNPKVNRTATAAAAPNNAALNRKQAADKESAKDKVKRQRLSGQSGIGSDFKEWRSEEFMKQRQQYD